MPPSAPDEPEIHPRPLLARPGWQSLDGPWAFAYDDDDRGVAAHWYARDERGPFTRTIVVPFPPESAASGIADTGYHPVVWYRRALRVERSPGRRVLLHLGAVDHDASVWVDGQHVGDHHGGYTAFALDVTDALAPGAEHELVVRAHDDPHDSTVPRGKQDWELEPHDVWYHRSTGVWRTVWWEEVPEQHVAALQWSVSLAEASVTADVELARPPAPGTTVTVRLRHAGTVLATVGVAAADRSVRVVAALPALAHGQARAAYLWSPEHPELVDASVAVEHDGVTVDAVTSYVGVRTVGTGDGRFLLNGQPYEVRAVLEQGYWPDSLYTPPSPTALRDEVALIRSLGFTAARVHQKVEDPRFLYWADRLGLLLWAEMPSPYRSSPAGAQRLLGEWLDAVQQQRSHPSVVTWVPLNESWGVQDLADDDAQRALARALAEATRALDPSRPVLSNDGWEHQCSDIVGLHDYDGDPVVLARRYADDEAVERLLEGVGPARRPVFVGGARHRGQPVMVTEFGGIAFQPQAARADGWGYTSAHDADEWVRAVTALYDALRASTALAGTCYTQLTDTRQETNGLCTADRRPKAPLEAIRRAVTGETR